MTKFFSIVVAALALPACTVVDPVFGTGEATVVAVDHTKGCSVTFHVKGQEQTYMTEADTPYKRSRCHRLQPGMTVPVVLDPIVGNYPYVLFE